MKDEYVLILGANSDIAIAIAREYAKNGYNLYLASRNVSNLEKIAKDIEIRNKIRVKIFKFDVLDFDNHENFYNSLPKKPIGVISAIGYLGEQKKAEKDFKESKKIIDTNYTGIVNILNIIANDFEKRKKGFIIGISSVAGDRGRKSNYIYGSAKSAFTTYLSGLRNRLFNSNVHVLTVKPGFVATKMTKNLELPKNLTALPEEVAKDIFRAQQNGKDILYTKWIWKWIMCVIIHIPEKIFKRLSI
jgi:short-subunit dehydrogenase